MTYYNHSALRSYEAMRDAWHNIKPLRGREEDLRPIGDRRRTHEQVVRVHNPDGEDSYAARLYNTNVVTYNHDGSIDLYAGGWATPSTAKFMDMYTPRIVGVAKHNNNIVLYGHGQELSDGAGFEVQIVPKDKLIKLTRAINPDGTRGRLIVDTPVVLTQKVVNRSAMKAVRARIKEFTDFATTMLKLSDGWLMHETLEPYVKIEDSASFYTEYLFGFDNIETQILQGRGPYKYWGTDTKARFGEAYKSIISKMETHDTDTWQRIMYRILTTIDAVEHRVAKPPEMKQVGEITLPIHFYDKRYTVDQFKRRMDRILKVDDNMHTTRTVDGNAMRRNLIVD